MQFVVWCQYILNVSVVLTCQNLEAMDESSRAGTDFSSSPSLCACQLGLNSAVCPQWQRTPAVIHVPAVLLTHTQLMADVCAVSPTAYESSSVLRITKTITFGLLPFRPNKVCLNSHFLILVLSIIFSLDLVSGVNGVKMTNSCLSHQVKVQLKCLISNNFSCFYADRGGGCQGARLVNRGADTVSREI